MKIEFVVKSPRLFVFSVDGKARMPAMSAAWSVRCIAFFQKGLPNTLALPAAVHCKTREEHDRGRVTRQPLACT
jgi:hypothetical protein